MTRSQMIDYIKENPYVPVSHTLFSDEEFIYAGRNGNVYDENGYLFENWESVADMWSGVKGIRLRHGGHWETGWYLK